MKICGVVARIIAFRRKHLAPQFRANYVKFNNVSRCILFVELALQIYVILTFVRPSFCISKTILGDILCDEGQ